MPDTELAGALQHLVTTGTHEDDRKGMVRSTQGELKTQRGCCHGIQEKSLKGGWQLSNAVMRADLQEQQGL